MAYRAENFRAVRERFAEKRSRALQEAEARRAALHASCPEIMQIDEALAKTGMRIFQAATAAGDNAAERVRAIRRENEELLAERRALLEALGLPANHTEPQYACSLCNDTGYVNCNLCACMRRELTLEGFRTSGIGHLIERQSFQNFSLKYYRDSEEQYERMAANLERAKQFAESSPPAYANLLFVGATGLGKTHLSTSIARRVIERGFDVKYETAQTILSDFEHDRFRTGYGNRDQAERGYVYMEAELLIIDDLGTEMTNSFSVSILYQLINHRINQGLPTIISTNLGQNELRERYTDRITSRLFGEFEPLLFRGKDVRCQLL